MPPKSAFLTITSFNFAINPGNKNRSCYWPTMINGNILLILFEQYMLSGYFSVCGRIGDALIQLMKQLLVGCVVGAIIALSMLACK